MSRDQLTYEGITIDRVQVLLFAIWRTDVLPHVVAAYELDGIPDKPARRESWNNWIDALAKDDIIDEATAADIGHPDTLEWARVESVQ